LGPEGRMQGEEMAHHTTDIPKLLILAADALILHEDVDVRRVEPLVERLQVDGFLKNPPIAAPIDCPLGCQGRHVILDGANRTTALWKLEAPHHLVQVVDYHEVELDTWGHLVTGISREVFTQSLSKAGLELESTTREDARERLARREIAASITAPDGYVFAVRGAGSLASETQALRRLASVYNGRSVIHRVKTDRMADLLPYYDDVTALIRFPSYEPEDILRLADDGHKLPTGITRHVIHGRALRVNMPLSLLMDEHRTTEQKNQWLRDWIKQKLAQREIRYYQESTFLFDE
jgi:hypothetical protein